MLIGLRTTGPWLAFSKLPKNFFKCTKFISSNAIFDKFQMKKSENFTRSRSMFGTRTTLKWLHFLFSLTETCKLPRKAEVYESAKCILWKCTHNGFARLLTKPRHFMANVWYIISRYNIKIIRGNWFSLTSEILWCSLLRYIFVRCHVIANEKR